MRHLLAFLFVFAMAAAQAAERPLLIWINSDKAYRALEQVGQQYTRQTGIRVVVEHPADAPLRFAQAAQQGSGPDIWIWEHDRLGSWVKSGAILPVSPPDTLRQNTVQAGWQAFQLQGKTWGYPLAIETVGLIYNKNLINEPPHRFEEIESLQTRLADRGIRAIDWDYTNAYYSWPLLSAGGAFAFAREADGQYRTSRTGLNVPGSVRAAHLLQRWVDQRLLPAPVTSSYRSALDGFLARKTAMIISGPWSWRELENAGIPFAVADLPSFEGRPSRPFIGVLGAMIGSHSQNPLAAREFIERYLLQANNLRALNADVPLGVPTNKQLFNEVLASNRFYGSVNFIHQGYLMPSIEEMQRFWVSANRALQHITLDRKSPRTVLDSAAEQISGNPESRLAL